MDGCVGIVEQTDPFPRRIRTSKDARIFEPARTGGRIEVNSFETQYWNYVRIL